MGDQDTTNYSKDKELIRFRLDSHEKILCKIDKKQDELLINMKTLQVNFSNESKKTDDLKKKVETNDKEINSVKIKSGVFGLGAGGVVVFAKELYKMVTSQ